MRRASCTCWCCEARTRGLRVGQAYDTQDTRSSVVHWRLVSGSEPSARRFSLKVWADLLVVEKKKPVEKKVVVEKEEEWELPDVPKNSTMIGTTAFDEDSVESKDEIVDDVLKSMETEKEEDLGPWKAAVEMLQEMGFDPKRFRELLKRHNGDIQAIMADMLK